MKKVLWLIVCLMTMVFVSCGNSKSDLHNDIHSSIIVCDKMIEGYASGFSGDADADSTVARIESFWRAANEEIIKKYGEDAFVKELNRLALENGDGYQLVNFDHYIKGYAEMFYYEDFKKRVDGDVLDAYNWVMTLTKDLK